MGQVGSGPIEFGFTVGGKKREAEEQASRKSPDFHRLATYRISPASSCNPDWRKKSNFIGLDPKNFSAPVDTGWSQKKEYIRAFSRKADSVAREESALKQKDRAPF